MFVYAVCVWASHHTVVTKLSHRRPSSADVCKWIRTRSLHETKAKQIFFCTRLCGEKWPNGSSKALQWTLRPLIRSMEGKYGAPTHAWTQKNQWKRTQSWHFERLAMMNLPLVIAIVWFRWERHNLTVETRIKCISTFVSCGLSNFQITCWTAQTEGIQRRRGGWKSVALLYYIC